MIQWHKKIIEKTLNYFGISHYQAYWICGLEGLIIGGLIAYYCF